MQNGIIDTRPTIKPDTKIIKQDVAKILYLAVYGNNQNFAQKFSTYFQDFLIASDKSREYLKYALALSYLEFKDGVAPFDRTFVNFNPGNTVKRKYFVKALMEVFNVDVSNISGSNPFDDVPSDTKYYKYIYKAYQLGVTTEIHFRPDDEISRKDAFVMLYRALVSDKVSKPTKEELADEDNYFIPLNYNRLNSGISKGLYEGVFQNYAKGAFAMSDIGFDLDFGIIYNSYAFEQPSQLYLNNCLSTGWSHNYNIKIVEVDAKGYISVPYEGSEFKIENDLSCVVFPNASIHFFHRNDATGTFIALTKGVYYKLTKISDTQYNLTTKNKTVLTFTKQLVNKYGNNEFYLTSMKDRNDNEMVIQYRTDDKYLIDKVISESGRELSFSYENKKLVEVSENSLNRKVTLGYSDNRLASFTDAEGKTTEYFYDDLGNPHTQDLLNKIKLPKGNTISVEYTNRRAKAVKTSEGMVTTIKPKTLDYTSELTQSIGGKSITKNYNFEPKDESNPTKVYGMLKSTTVNGVTTTYNYDPNAKNPLIPTSVNSNGITSTPTFDDATGNLLETKIETASYTIKESYTYNPTFNFMESYTDANGNTIRIKYDNKGNARQITYALGFVTTIDYNSHGLPISVTNPEGITVTYDNYDNHGNAQEINAPMGFSTQLTYDEASRPKTVTVNGKTTSYKYDLVDNLLLTTDALNHKTQYLYDENYNLQTIINAKGDATTLTYDYETDLLKSVTFGNSTEKYSYLADGSFDKLTKPSGKFLTNAYDSKGRLTSNGYRNLTYYESGDFTDMLKTANNTNGTLNYFYDELKRIDYYTDYFGNTVGYKYDLVGNITKLIYPDNKTVTYTYNANNQLKTVKADWLNKTIVTYTYRNDGLLETETYANEMVTTYTYDAAGRLENKEIKKSNNSILQSWTYVWDLSGNITSDTASQNLFSEYPTIVIPEIKYHYNNENRIENITGEQNISFTFDADGNQTSKTGNTFTYDINDRLTGVNGNFTATYEYDAFGMRRKAIRNGTESRYVLDIAGMEDVIAETDANDNIKWYYIQGIGMAARISPSGEIQYYHHDFRGSTIAITDESENVTHKYSYDEFGTVLQSQEADYNEFRYVGRYGVSYESEDLQFMRARFVDNKIGRFLSEDPIWSTNLYPYAGNNPIMYIDPEGTTIFLGVTEWALPRGILIADAGKTVVPLPKPGGVIEEFLRSIPSDIIKPKVGRNKISQKIGNGSRTQNFEQLAKQSKVEIKKNGTENFFKAGEFRVGTHNSSTNGKPSLHIKNLNTNALYKIRFNIPSLYFQPNKELYCPLIIDRSRLKEKVNLILY